jgi:hypothetical protein
VARLDTASVVCEVSAEETRFVLRDPDGHELVFWEANSGTAVSHRLAG